MNSPISPNPSVYIRDMPESGIHADLVQALIRFAERKFDGLANIAVREDSVRPMRGERPPRIEGFVPDVFATNVPTTITLIGEAKTQQDLERDHSRRQIFAFLSYLSKTQQGIFVLCVPLSASATARRILSEINRSFPTADTQTVVLDHPIWAR